jgi:hypothetical protein
MPLFWLSIHGSNESKDDNNIITCGINLFSFYVESSNHQTNDIFEYMWFDVTMPILLNITSIQKSKTNLCMKLQLRNCIVSSPFHTIQYQKLLPNSYIDCNDDYHNNENMTTTSMLNTSNKIRYFEWTTASTTSVTEFDFIKSGSYNNNNVKRVNFDSILLCLLVSIILRIFARLWKQASSSSEQPSNLSSHQQVLYTTSNPTVYLLLNGSPEEIFLEKLAEVPGNNNSNTIKTICCNFTLNNY